MRRARFCTAAMRGLLAAALGSALPSLGRAEDLASSGKAHAPELELRTEACAAGFARELAHFTHIELGAARGDGAAGAQPLAVHVRCAGALAEIAVEARASGTRTHRSMDLSSTEAGVRARVVALAIAGLSRELSLMARGDAEPERAAAPAPQASPPAPAVAADGEQERVQLEALLLAASFGGSSDLLFGGGARLHTLGTAPLRLAFDLSAGTSTHRVELGTARLLVASAAARIGVPLELGAVTFTPGAGQRAGLARASASARAGARDGSVLGAWTGPLAFAALDTALAGRLRAGLDVELGAVLLPVRGRVEGGEDIGAKGLWLSLSAAIGLRF